MNVPKASIFTKLAPHAKNAGFVQQARFCNSHAASQQMLCVPGSLAQRVPIPTKTRLSASTVPHAHPVGACAKPVPLSKTRCVSVAQVAPTPLPMAANASTALIASQAGKLNASARESRTLYAGSARRTTTHPDMVSRAGCAPCAPPGCSWNATAPVAMTLYVNCAPRGPTLTRGLRELSARPVARATHLEPSSNPVPSIETSNAVYAVQVR